MKYVAQNLRLLRHYNKMDKFFSQKDISKISKIPQTHISRIESLKESVRLYDLMFYCVFFNVSADDILFKDYNAKTKEFEPLKRKFNVEFSAEDSSKNI